MQTSKLNVLCVDDDQDNLDLAKMVFEFDGFEVTACDSPEECLVRFKEKDFAAIILDYRIKNRESLEVCREIRLLDPHVPIVFYSGEARQSEIERALDACADAFLIKPNDFERLTETVNKLILERRSAG